MNGAKIIEAFKGFVVIGVSIGVGYLLFHGLISDMPVEAKIGWSAICVGIFLVIFFVAKKER